MSDLRRRGCKVAFVATMGNLHPGHLELIKTARRYGDAVVVSLYVNPMQFGPNEDFSTYPRTLQEDKAMLVEEGADILFLPDDQIMYPRGQEKQTTVQVPELGSILEGVTRPHFFAGVCTVVARLFNIVQADVSVFGKKDYQQFVIVRRMVDDLAIPIRVVGHDTVREPDGLAMSSRNSYLDDAQRKIAPALHQVLRGAADTIRSGNSDYERIESEAVTRLKKEGMRPDYVSIRCQSDLAVPSEGDLQLVVLGAAYVGETRLIDNIEVGVYTEGS